MQAAITELLSNRFVPTHLSVTNESHMHNVAPGAETHFKVVIVSDSFEGQSLVMRHREINRLLAGLFQQGLHALALHTMTPQEWFNKGGNTPESPECLGGSKMEMDR